MAHGHTAKTFSASDVTLPADAGLSRLRSIGLIMALVGLGVTFGLGAANSGAMFTSYLVAFMFWLSIALGGYFFVSIFFLGRSAWNVGIRRIAENAMSTLPVFAILFIPVVFGMDYLYHWTDPALEGVDPLLDWKKPYLNRGFFLGRAVVYFLIWSLFAYLFYSKSIKQDETGDKEITRKLQALGAPAVALGALTVTFAAVDWLMTLDFHWFSTIFGVYYFAGGFVAMMAFMALIAIVLRKHVSGALTEEQLHGIGQLMFAFNVFWSYIAFSQFFLIWYGNIPEETLWFGYRYEGAWRPLSMLLLVGHFILPFFFLLPRAMKRKPATLAIGAVWLLLMHFLDVFWLVKPAVLHAHGIHGMEFGILDITAMIGVGGVFLAVFGHQLKTKAAVAFNDPRMPEALKYENM